MAEQTITGLNRIQEIAANLPDDVPRINLLVGQPDHPAPDSMSRRAANLIRIGMHNEYTAQPGDPGFRDVLAELVSREGFQDVDRENMFVSSGAKLTAFQILLGHMKPGETIALLNPHYPAYARQTKWLQTRPRFAEDIGHLEDLLQDPKVTAAAIVTPDNPTGSIISNDDLRRVIDSAREDQLIVIDEAYMDFAYGEERFTSIGTEIDFQSRGSVAIVRTFSKSYGACGWKVGYSVTSADMVGVLTEIQKDISNPATSIFQHAARIDVLNVPDSYFAENRERYRGRLSTSVSELNDRGVEATMPDGGLYSWLKLPRDGEEFAVKLAENTGILVWPGRDYGVDDAVRISMSKLPRINLPEINDEGGVIPYVAERIAQTLMS